VTSREGATARDGSRPGRRRRGIASALVRVRRPHRQQAPSQRVCGRGTRMQPTRISFGPSRAPTPRATAPARIENGGYCLRRAGETLGAGGWRGWRLHCPRFILSTASCRSRALPSTASAALPSTASGAAAALPAVTAKPASTNQEAGFPLAPRQGKSGSVLALFGSV
jgi:hypothetical protein